MTTKLSPDYGGLEYRETSRISVPPAVSCRPSSFYVCRPLFTLNNNSVDMQSDLSDLLITPCLLTLSL
jgi:hypothetical protein